ncbi:ISAs1 family transposase [Thorsellia kenyensis]|uniref:ISAs1 family transposase n=1 Tax=Thorsellia kenyensis TaxID=1549888 RepID=A0ABV6CB73_9GAMM
MQDLSEQYTTSISLAFSELNDPRGYGVKHPLINIISMTLCAIISGCDNVEAISMHAQARKDFFARFLDLTAGIPSADTFHDVLNRIKPAEFTECFNQWVKGLKTNCNDIIAIDGKTLRGTADKKNNANPIHLVNAWSVENQLCFGQVRVSDKSNEITAIPTLIKMLDIKGATVTVDAMGCQHAIAGLIVSSEANYVMALKGNQGSLNEDVRLFLKTELEQNFTNTKHSFFHEVDGNHGRIEERHVWMTTEVEWLRERHENWKSINSIIVVKSIREIKNQADTQTEELRFYISSEINQDAKWIAQVIRGHWQVENNLHWQLDVSFREDELSLRSGYAAENISFMNKLTISLLKKEQTLKASIKNKRMVACIQDEYLLKVLNANNFID